VQHKDIYKAQGFSGAGLMDKKVCRIHEIIRYVRI